VGLDVATARGLTADSLLLLLRMGPDDVGRVRLAADLLELDAAIAEADGRNAEAANHREKAGRLRDAVNAT
jgi:hypothetical protein